MEIPDIPFDALSYTLVAVTFALPMAFPVSLALLWVYLRAVKRSMLRRAAGEPTEPAPSAHDASGQTIGPPEKPLQIAMIPAAAIPIQWTATRRVWLTGIIHAIAGVAFAYVMGTVFLLANGLGFDWQVALGSAMLYAWPIVIVLGLVCAVSWLGLGLLVLGYALVLAATMAVLAAGTTITASQVASVWFAHNRDGTLLALASLAPPIRAVGPLVAVFMIAIVAGAIFILPAIYNSDTALVLLSAIDIRLHFGVYGTIALVLLSGAILMGLIGWLWLRWLGRRYRAQRLSDQSIMVDAVLLIFGFEYSIGFAQKGPVWLLAPVAAILAYKIVATTELRLLRRYDPPDVDPKQLLLLRVFSLGRRSGRLFGGFSKLWRHVGTLRMIAGPDLATSTVEPHEFLDFLAGHLQRRFISGPAALEQRLAESKPRCDPDGRYRSSNFFCYDDTWKMVLGRLAEDSDAVLMDLRGFTKEARGCIYEIHELLDVVPLECIVFVIDRTSDEISLAHVFSDGWARLCATSPNRADLTPRVRLMRIDGLYGPKIGSLVALLAATTDPRGRQVVRESSHPAGPVPGSAPV